MAIESVGNFQNILNNGSVKKWVRNDSVEMGDQKLPRVIKVNPGSEKSFGEFLTDSLTQVNNLQREANVAVQKLSTGESRNIHETLLAVEKADIAFRTMNQLRQKVLDAYKDVMKMQV